MTGAVPGGTRSVLMLRHAAGSYAYLDLSDDRGIRGMLPSNDAQDHGRVWWVLTERADADGGRLLRIALQAGGTPPGFWWGPRHPRGRSAPPPGAGGPRGGFSSSPTHGSGRRAFKDWKKT